VCWRLRQRTVSTISSSPTSEKMSSTHNGNGTLHRRRRKNPALPETANAGTQAARSWITIATATSISSSRITIDLDLKTAPVPESGPCLYKGVMVACGPPGLNGGKTFCFTTTATARSPTSAKNPASSKANGTYGHRRAHRRSRHDGWPDIYVANDSTAALFIKIKRTAPSPISALEAGCALSADGQAQAGMGISAADYNLDGNLDLVKTNFAGDTPSLYRNIGGANFEDATFRAASASTRNILAGAVGFFRLRQRRLGRHPDLQRSRVSRSRAAQNGSGLPAAKSCSTKICATGALTTFPFDAGTGHLHAGGCAGLRVWRFRQRRRQSTSLSTPSMIFRNCCGAIHAPETIGSKSKTIGTKSNRSGIRRAHQMRHASAGRKTNLHPQIDEVRSGGGYFSQNDLRVHFGIGKAEKVELLEIRWPSGLVETLKDIKTTS